MVTYDSMKNLWVVVSPHGAMMYFTTRREAEWFVDNSRPLHEKRR